MPMCWGIAGSAGMSAQVQALAMALDVTLEMKQLSLKKPLTWIPNQFYTPSFARAAVSHFLDAGSDKIAPPWPDLVISCGRRAAIIAMGLRSVIRSDSEGLRQDSSVAPPNDKKTIFIHIQDPQMAAQNFDLVVAMAHDKITGPNIIKTRFALHAITPEVLAEASLLFAPKFASYLKPHIAVLLGGSTNKYTFKTRAMEKVIENLQTLLSQTQGSLLITPSRRTGEQNIARLHEAFSNNPRVFIYDFVGENPYLGLLALADNIVVTNDSVNMMSEAHATGKPIYSLKLSGHENTKPARFAEAMIQDGIAKPLGDRLESWNYPVAPDMKALAAEIRRRLVIPENFSAEKFIRDPE